MILRRSLILATGALLLVALGCHHVQAASEPAEIGPVTITIETTPRQTQVKRLGINLSGQSFYDSGQMLRNLTFRNPGFEGETWQSILHCKVVTATTCTDENQYAVWPANFLAGGRLDGLSGAARGATATVTDMHPAEHEHGVTLTLAHLTHPLSTGDFVFVRVEKPGDAQAGWWTDLKGSATLATEFHDLSPHSPGRQALRIEAAAPGQSAVLSSYFDSLAGHSFVHLNGRYTLSFRARSIAGAPALAVKLERLDTVTGVHTFFSRTVPLTTQWQDFHFDFSATEAVAAAGTVGLSFTFAGTSALLDDVALEAIPTPGNPTAFRNEVVQTLRDLHPGVLRYMDNGTNFGSSLDNLLAPPFARQRAGASTQESRHEDIAIGLHEFLTLCTAVDAEPWFAMPPGTTPAEATALVEYLAGDAATPYGARRAALGQHTPWTHIFHTIHLELGNEQWNARSFAGATINDPTAYGQRASQIFAAMRAAPAFTPQVFDLILGSWATVPWWSKQELASSTAYDSLAVAPYLFNDFNDAHSTEAIFGPMFAEPEAVDSPGSGSRPAGYMAQQAEAARTALHPAHVAVYETNLGMLSGSVAQADLNRTAPSLGAGLAVIDHMLLMLRDLGVTTQCLFALPEYVNDFIPTAGPKLRVPLWGAVVDMGGATNRRRPQFLAEQLANSVILPTLLTTRVTGTPQTWVQPESGNGEIKLDHAHLLQTFAFADGPRRSLIVLNLSRDHAIPVLFASPSAPARNARVHILAAATLDANNEQTQQVAVQRGVAVEPGKPYTLPAFSMTVMEWSIVAP